MEGERSVLLHWGGSRMKRTVFKLLCMGVALVSHVLYLNFALGLTCHDASKFCPFFHQCSFVFQDHGEC